MSKLHHFLTVTVIFLFTLTGHAQNIDFGAEFVFTNDLMIKQTQAPTQAVTPEGQAKFRQWAQKIQEYCQSGGGCETKKGTVKGQESLKVSFADGFWIEISPDPSVLEVTMAKGNVGAYQSQKDRIESIVFGMARELGLYVHDRIGGGHISIDVNSAFRGNAKLFRNFIVDYTNHPELAWGVLGNHIGNAPPVSALDRKSKEAFYDVIRNFDRRPSDIPTLANLINERVYTSNPFNWQSYGHYQAIRLNQVNSSSSRIEMRGFAPQKSLEDFLKLCAALETRIQFLSQFNHPIEPQLAKSEKMAPAERMARAASWFQEMGLNINDYRSVVIADHRDVMPAPELRPLAENMNSLGIAKPPYYGVDLLYSQTSEKDHANFKDASTKLSGDERYLVPYPKMISESEKDLLVKGTEQRGRAMMAFLRDLQGQQKFLNERGLSKAVVERILVNNDMTWEAVRERMSSSMGFVYAPDVVKGSDGRYVVLEDNVSANTGGLGDAKQSREDFLKLLPEFAVLLKSENGDGFAKRVKEFLQKHSDGKAVVFVLPASHQTFNQFYIKQLLQAGIYVVTNDKNSQVRINSKGEVPVVNVFKNGKLESSREVGAVFYRGFGTEFRNEFPNTFKAGVEGKIKLVGYKAFDFLGDKELSPYVEDMIRYYLKEEPIVRFAETVSMSQVGENGKTVLNKETLENVFSKLEKWVIKDTTGLQGKGVWIGQFVNEKEALKKMIIENPGAYIAQEYIPVSRLNRWISDIRIHSMVLGAGAVASDVFWGRAVSIFDNGKLNTHQNAGAIPIFVEGRDTLPLADRKAMHDLFLAKDLESVFSALKRLMNHSDSRFKAVVAEWRANRPHVLSELAAKLTPRDRKAVSSLLNQKGTPPELRLEIWTIYLKDTRIQLARAKNANEYLQILGSAKGASSVLIRNMGVETLKHFESLNPTPAQRKSWIANTGHVLLGQVWQKKGLLPPSAVAPAGIRCEMVFH